MFCLDGVTLPSTQSEKQPGALKTQDHKSTGENTSSPVVLHSALDRMHRRVERTERVTQTGHLAQAEECYQFHASHRLGIDNKDRDLRSDTRMVKSCLKE